MYWHIPAITLGKRTMRNFNTLIGRYEGADGMKTGFICASGFNLVASASRNGKRLIAVVLGAPSSPYRAAKAAGLLERGFHRGPLSWLSPSLGSVNSLQPINTAPPDLRDEMCGPHRKRPAAEEADDDAETSDFILSKLAPGAKGSALLKERPDTVKAITVFIGAAKQAAQIQFANARIKIQKLTKGSKPNNDIKTTDAKAAAAKPALQTATAPPADAFTQSSQSQQTVRQLPTATSGNNPALSYAPTGKADPAPLTALPDAKPAAYSRAKTAGKPAEPATTAPAAKPKAKPQTKPQAKSAAKPKAATAKQAATKPDATAR
jgi:D-alanyl-D-alanine carboxypeptidase